MNPGWVFIFCSCSSFKTRVVMTPPLTFGTGESGCWLSCRGQEPVLPGSRVRGQFAAPIACGQRSFLPGILINKFGLPGAGVQLFRGGQEDQPFLPCCESPA